MLVPQYLEPAAFEQPVQIGCAEIGQMSRNVDSRPALAQQQKLPAGGVWDLHNQSSLGRKQFVRGTEVASWIVKMFQDVKHGDCRATSRREWRLRKRSAHCRNARPPPSRVSRIHREIETRYGTRALRRAAFDQHLQEQAAAAAGVRDNPLGLRFTESSLDEMQ